MKHEGELVGREWLERDTRIEVIYDVTVHCPAGGNASKRFRTSLDDRLHNRILEVAVQLAVRIVGLNHHDPDKFLFWIYPESRAAGATPTVVARRAIERGDTSVAPHREAKAKADARSGRIHHVIDD